MTARRRTLHTLLLTAVLVLLAPAAAGAHARLLSSDPADEAVVQSDPGQVQLHWSSSVVVEADGVQVFGPDGARVDHGAPSPTSGATTTQTIDASKPGTYGVAYRVSSEDGHVVTGSTTFSVGTASGDSSAIESASRDATEVDRPLQALFSGARFVELLALLTAAGGGLFACCIGIGQRPRLVVPALLLLLLAYGLGYLANAAIARGAGIGDVFDLHSLGEGTATPFARSVLIRAVVAAVAIGPALLLRHGGGTPSAGARWAMALVFAGLAASLSITGHAVTTAPIAVRMPLDMLHVIVASVWLGGLVQLGPLARRIDDSALRSIVRFSRAAFVSVAVLVVTGAIASWIELGPHPRELLHDDYGRLLVAKLVLLLGVLPLAWNNMGAFVPALRARPEDAGRMVRQYVARELLVLVVVVALTVWLIATAPPHATG